MSTSRKQCFSSNNGSKSLTKVFIATQMPYWMWFTYYCLNNMLGFCFPGQCSSSLTLPLQFTEWARASFHPKALALLLPWSFFSKGIHMPTSLTSVKLWLKYCLLIKPTLISLYHTEDLSPQMHPWSPLPCWFFSPTALTIYSCVIYCCGLICPYYSLTIIQIPWEKICFFCLCLYTKYINRVGYNAVPQALLKTT